jgi:hypothetical protein
MGEVHCVADAQTWLMRKPGWRAYVVDAQYLADVQCLRGGYF